MTSKKENVRRVHVVFPLLDLRDEESHVLRRVIPSRCGEATRKSRALSRVRTQAIGELARGFYPLSYPSARMSSVKKGLFEGYTSLLAVCTYV